MASEPKELYVVEGAMHIDLYDDATKIPFDKIESLHPAAELSEGSLFVRN